jgi:hypothetical protein
MSILKFMMPHFPMDFVGVPNTTPDVYAWHLGNSYINLLQSVHASTFAKWRLQTLDRVSTNVDVVVADYCALAEKSELVNHIPKTFIGFSCCQRLFDIR